MACPSPPLEELLDVSNLHSVPEISSRFLKIAESILSAHCLRVDYGGTSTDFEIIEIEFYLRKKGVHEDPFCHAHHDQRKSAQWYFHRPPSRASSSDTPTQHVGYRGGTRKGLDLTFGGPVTPPMSQDPAPQICGGILLRSMRSMDDSRTVISGPSLLVDKILSITDSRNISELVNIRLGRCLSALSPTSETGYLYSARLYLAARPAWRPGARTPPVIHRSPRIGLDLAHPSVTPQRNNDRVMFISKLYRYFILPELLTANGRYHTFIGILLEQNSGGSATNELLHSPRFMAQMITMTMLKRVTIERYIKDYAQGLTKRSLVEFVGSAGKGASTNPQMFMRLMGVLRRMGLLVTQDED